MFKEGQKFKHYQGYIWKITEVTKRFIKMESAQDGYTIHAGMTQKDLQNVIKAGYYTEVID